MDKRILEHILREQRESLDLRYPAEYLVREIEPKVRDLFGSCLLIHGVRGCGKTTLCHRLLRDAGIPFAYICFDDSRIAKLRPADMPEILEVLLKIDKEIGAIFFDQMPVSSEWIDTIAALEGEGFKIVAARSGNPEGGFTAGRFKEVLLTPLSFREYCVFSGVDTDSLDLRSVAARRAAFDEYLHVGGFPGLLNNTRRVSYLRKLTDAIIDIDLLRRFNISNHEEFRRFTERIIADTPLAVPYTQMLKEFSFKSEHTLKKYVSYLKESAFVTGLHKIAFFSKRRTIGEKYYPADHSLLAPDVRVLPPAIIERRLATIVCHEIMRRFDHPDYRIHYFNERAAECEFVICRDYKMQHGVQVCLDATDEKALRRKAIGLTALAKVTGCTDLTILTDNQKRQLIVQGYRIELVPAHELLLGIE